MVVLGISKDTVSSHKRFSDKYELSFAILSDTEHEVLQKYGAWQEKKLYGKTYMGTARCTYLLDEEGRVELAMPKVNPKTNAEEILKYIRG